MKTFILAMVILGLGVLEAKPSEKSSAKEPEILFYRNAMNPSVTSPTPKKDSMGMDYVPVYKEGTRGSNDKAGTVTIDPTVVQNIGVRTALVVEKPLSKIIRAVGRVAFDETRMAHLHPKIEGWVEKIWVDKTGQKVKKGDKLFSVYSPKLVSAQQEYLLALSSLKILQDSPFDEIRQGAVELVKSSKERLRLLDVPAHQIRELERSRKIQKNLHVHSTVDGTVIRIGLRKGQYLTPQTELYMIVDLGTAWVYADVYEYELPWIKQTDKVEMTLASIPGKVFHGSLEYIYPYAEANTRTTKIRLIFDNKKGQLRPDMFANLKIHAGTKKHAIVIPVEAVVRSGDKTQVFVVKRAGKYEPRLVTLGNESGGEVSILSGLKVGERVVTSAQFLIDSESKLREATQKMMNIKPTKPSMKMDSKKPLDMRVKE